MRVLVVDPSREQRAQIVLSLCELTNVVVVGAVGGVRSALHALAEATPDVVVTAECDLDLIIASQRCQRPPDVIVFGDAAADCLDAGASALVSSAEGLEGLQRALVSTSSRRKRPTGH
jgi:DNA-binding NarL/FixJ family response regulator